MSSADSAALIWKGKPWIAPSAIARTVTIFVILIVIIWLELTFGAASIVVETPILSAMSLVWWTFLVFFLVWLFSILHLLLIRASSTYVLHGDSLEIRTGIVTSKSFVVSASGFSDLEVVRTISGRILNSGDIIIRTQSETGAERRLSRIKEPLRVADQIRQVMARPIVRMEGSQPPKSS